VILSFENHCSLEQQQIVADYLINILGGILLILLTYYRTVTVAATGSESVPIQSAQCRFPRLAISSAKILMYFSNKICGSNFIKQHSETVMV